VHDAWEQGLVDPKTKEELDARLGDAYLLAGCMDLRYCMKMRHPLKHVTRRFDLVTFAGCVHCLSEPEDFPGLAPPYERICRLHAAAKEIVHLSLELAVQKHDIKRILLSTHQECGFLAWQGRVFNNSFEEEEKHREDRLRAARWVFDTLALPDIQVFTCFSYLDHEGLVQIKDFEEVRAELTVA
jgi:hypothetical protein